MKPPFSDRESTLDAFARHVSRGKVAFFQKVGLDLMAGEREGRYLLPTLVPIAPSRLGAALAVDQVRGQYAQDARMWHLLQRLRRV